MLNEQNAITGKKRFSDESNVHYRIESVELIDTELLSNMIRNHQSQQVPRLKTLREYYKGNNEGILVSQRRREQHLADNRATHNFAKYVSQFIQGYMVGVPLKTSYPDESVNELIRDINIENDADEHNSDLVLDQSIYGRAYELVYRNQNDETRFTTLDVTETFVIYDETIECKPIAAVRYFGSQWKKDGTVYLYTDNEIHVYALKDGNKLEKKDVRNHFFGAVPIVEYENNKYRQGDFEDVLSLIDLYDASQSDTANYMTDINDAMLMIKGNLDIDVEEAQEMKERNILMLQTETDADGKTTNADADYIYKKYDVAGTEAYKDRLFNNILLFTSIPNLLNDKAERASQSGEALKMKLFALSQKRATKERLFKKSLRDRYRLINNIMGVASEGSFDVNEISVTFTENLPSMVDKEIEWFIRAGGILSQRTLRENLSIVENAMEEERRVEEEREDADYPFAEIGDSNEESDVLEE